MERSLEVPDIHSFLCLSYVKSSPPARTAHGLGAVLEDTVSRKLTGEGHGAIVIRCPHAGVEFGSSVA